jgi:hypothetical protein
MATTSCPVSSRHIGETAIATSSPHGTVLPRSGVFWGVRPPQYHSAVVVDNVVLDNFARLGTHETQVRSWLEPHGHLLEQTNMGSFPVRHLRLMNFEVDFNGTLMGHADLTSNQFTVSPYSQVGTFGIIRNVDVACAFAPKWGGSTDSSWQNFRDAMNPLLKASSEILEAIGAALERRNTNSERSQHIGLNAVGWLIEALGFSRPTVLRMGKVAESTFYSWQKNPHAAARTRSVSRILQLQAQISLLDKALGRDGLRAWILAGDRLEGLQGGASKFAQTLAEAEEAVLTATRIVSRPRMRLEDYNLDTEQSGEAPEPEFSVWPGASKLPEELT